MTAPLWTAAEAAAATGGQSTAGWVASGVSIDSRSGAYGEAYTLDYLNAHFARDGWQTYLARLAPDFVLWERGGALATALAASPDWARVYADDVAVIFVRADHPLRAMLEHATAAGRTEA